MHEAACLDRLIVLHVIEPLDGALRQPRVGMKEEGATRQPGVVLVALSSVPANC